MKTSPFAVTLSASLTVLSSLTGKINAAIVYASYTGEVASSDIAGISPGDALLYVVSMDNGNSSLVNQTWNLTDIINVRFIANGGVIDTNFSMTFELSTGSFTTDGGGELDTVASIFDIYTIASSNLPNPVQGLNVNGGNSVFYTFEEIGVLPSQNINSVAPLSNQNADLWTLSNTNPVVPEPSSIALLGLGAVALLRRRRSHLA